MKPIIRAATLPTLLLITALGLWFGVGQPAHRDLPNIRHELAERRGQLEAYGLNSNTNNNAPKLQEKIDAARPILMTASLVRGQELDVIETIERLAANRGVTERLNLEDIGSINKNNWYQNKISIEITGSFTAITQYLADLRQLPWLMTFSTLNLTRDTAPNIRATLTGRIMWRTE
jgi:Tfp pilus assembly protein PilO